MSTIGFDSCFYERLDDYSRSLNHVLLSCEGSVFATEDDWRRIIELVQTLASHSTTSLAASSVAALLTERTGDKQTWEDVAQALVARKVDQLVRKELCGLAWCLDNERTEVLARMQNA